MPTESTFVIVGAGLAGAKAAETLRAEGFDGHGVEFRFGAQIEDLRDNRVVLADGTTLDADAVLIAVGVRPNTALAGQAGLDVGDGVPVDCRLRTSDPDIFAVGDVAAVDHPLLHARVRVEHWANALNAGPVAARAMLGQDVQWDALPYFFTDQYDWAWSTPAGYRPAPAPRW